MDQRMEEQKQHADKGEVLLWACARGLLADATALLGEGVDPNVRDKKGLRPVHYAAAKGHTDILRYLGSKAADLDAEDESGRAPLHYASTGGHVDATQFLVGKGSWVDATDSRDDTPLHLASRAGHTAVVKVLLDASAKPALRNKRQLTALGEALVAEHMDAVKALAPRTNSQLHAGNGFTLLHVAAGLGKATAVKWLLQQGEAKDLVNHAGNVDRTTPLHAAALAGDSTCIQLLLSHGAERDLEDAAGRTAADLLQANSTLDAATKERLMSALSTDNKQRSRASPAGPSGSSGTGAAAEQRSQELLEKCKRQVDGLSKKPEAELQHLEPAVRQAVLKVQALHNVVECYSALLTMRTDPGFREDVSVPQVRGALEEMLRGKPNQHADDPRVLAVLGKLRKLQGILSQHGRVKVTVEDLLTEPNPAEEQKKLAAMRSSLQAARETAARALAGGALEASQRQPEKSGVPTEIEEPMSEPATSDSAQEPQVPLTDRLGKEFMAQLAQAVIVAVVLLLVLWLTNRLPWQNPAWLEQKLMQSSAASQSTPHVVQQVVPQARLVPDHEDL